MVDGPIRERSKGPPSPLGDDEVTLPYAKAFVVHFSADTDARLEHATGRVEHLQTGCRSRFASIGELLACLRAELAGADRTAEKGEAHG
jgi:hypothetical protein